MIVPEGAVKTKATIWIGASLFSEKFKFEDNSVPVSPIVWTYINCQLLKPAELYIPHHIDVSSMESPNNHLYLVTADDKSILRDSTFTFKQTQKDKMTIESSLVKICAFHFCSHCCAVKEYEKIPKQYLLIQAEKIQDDNHALLVDFCLLYHQKICREVTKTYDVRQINFSITDS